MTGSDRSLRAANRPGTTRYNYLLAPVQLARYLDAESPDPESPEAAADPTRVSRGQIETFQAWMIDTRSAATALNKHKALQQWFRWLVAEEEVRRSPMDRVPQPKAPRKLIPILSDEDNRRLLDQCQGKGFTALRDAALVRLYANTGAGWPRSATCWCPMWTWPPSRCCCTAKVARTGGSGSGRRPPGRSAATYAPGPTTLARSCRSCGWSNAAAGRYNPTASKSGCAQAIHARLGIGETA